MRLVHGAVDHVVHDGHGDQGDDDVEQQIHRVHVDLEREKLVRRINNIGLHNS